MVDTNRLGEFYGDYSQLKSMSDAEIRRATRELNNNYRRSGEGLSTQAEREMVNEAITYRDEAK